MIVPRVIPRSFAISFKLFPSFKRARVFSCDEILGSSGLDFNAYVKAIHDAADCSVSSSAGPDTLETMSAMLEDVHMCDIAGIMLTKLINDNWPAIVDMSLKAKGLDPDDYSSHTVSPDGVSYKTGGGITWN